MKLIIYRLYWAKSKREKRAFDLVFTEQESIPSRTIAPITTGEEVTGFLSIIHKDGSNEDLRRMIVERSALVIAFEAYKLQAVMDTEQRLKGDFLDELLSEQWDKELILKHAKNMGYNFDVPHQILDHYDRTFINFRNEKRARTAVNGTKKIFKYGAVTCK